MHYWRKHKEKSIRFCIMKLYRGFKIHELDLHVSTWINLRNTMLCEKSKLQKEIHDTILFMSNVNPHKTIINLSVHVKL